MKACSTLIAFKTPDPLATFFAPWGLGVTTATQYERLARLPEPGEDRYATGGDGGAPGHLPLALPGHRLLEPGHRDRRRRPRPRDVRRRPTT